MPNNKELELERQALLMDMAGKIDFIYNILSQATIAQQDAPKEKKSERKNSKKTAKSD
jgi:hypothetical protein